MIDEKDGLPSDGEDGALKPRKPPRDPEAPKPPPEDKKAEGDPSEQPS